uniref:Uncharacterized protein n=1 Tax=Spironucleus salmonicida TaxID=348837 RepID=V6M259_9EUKA|eukprot:EST47299.1 Hypothetical protein SS50377_12646 [Spironucleus salmonicida]
MRRSLLGHRWRRRRGTPAQRGKLQQRCRTFRPFLVCGQSADSGIFPVQQLILAVREKLEFVQNIQFAQYYSRHITLFCETVVSYYHIIPPYGNWDIVVSLYAQYTFNPHSQIRLPTKAFGFHGVGVEPHWLPKSHGGPRVLALEDGQPSLPKGPRSYGYAVRYQCTVQGTICFPALSPDVTESLAPDLGISVRWAVGLVASQTLYGWDPQSRQRRPFTILQSSERNTPEYPIARHQQTLRVHESRVCTTYHSARRVQGSLLSLGSILLRQNPSWQNLPWQAECRLL